MHQCYIDNEKEVNLETDLNKVTLEESFFNLNWIPTLIKNKKDATIITNLAL